MTVSFKKNLAHQIQKNRKALWEWYCEKARLAPPPFYCSVDLRDAGFKITPVDSNLFPAGFNNICPEDLRVAPLAMRAQIDAFVSRAGLPTPGKILVIPEAHTTNVFYIENLYYLLQIIREAGFEVELGWYPPEQVGPVNLVSQTGKELTAHPIQVQDGVLSAGGFTPDLILLNNDFSSGYPTRLDGIRQPIVPSHTLGWHSRKKSEHFVYYNQLAGEFAKIVDIDPWTLQVDTEQVDHVNFGEDQGIEAVEQAVARVLERTRKQYEAHKIKQAPFVFVKNNSGTYGMGIMVVHSADEIKTMNRRSKNKMSVGKNKMPIQSVAVQEGVPTATLVDKLAAEPVIYLLSSELIGGFLRTNTERGVEENLNSQGMVFKKLCMSDLRKNPTDTDNAGAGGTAQSDDDDDDADEPVLELVYGTVARISALATGMEFQAHSRIPN